MVDVIKVWRDAEGNPQMNIRRTVHHSPLGISWGYHGSGPADLALSILQYAFRDEPRTVRLFEGECSQIAWDLHQRFKRDFVARLPEQGGEFNLVEVTTWATQQLEKEQQA